MINILDGLNNNIVTLEELKIQLPPYYYKEVVSYTERLSRALLISINNNHFALAEYFQNKMGNHKLNILRQVMSKLAQQRNQIGIDYLLKKDKTLSNAGMLGSVKIHDLDQIKWFIQQGSVNMNSGLLAAVNVDDGALVDFFISQGANKFHAALEHTARTGNETLFTFFLQQCGNNVQYIPVFTQLFSFNQVKLIHTLHTEMICNIPSDSYFTQLGPVLINLVQKLTFKNKLGQDYSDLFPLLKQGYILSLTNVYILENYMLENKLFRGFDKFVPNPELIEIFTQTPALYSNMKIKAYPYKRVTSYVYNTNYENSIEILKHLYPNFMVKKMVDICYLTKLVQLNTYCDTDLSTETINFVSTVEIRHQLIKEYTLLVSLNSS